MRARRRSLKEIIGLRALQDGPLMKRLTQLAQEHPRYGCKRLYVIYERGRRGKRSVHELQEISDDSIGLQICRSLGDADEAEQSTFAVRRCTEPSGRMTSGRWTSSPIGCFTGVSFERSRLLDERSRYAMAVDPAFSYPSASVVRTLEDATREHGYPKFLRIDNGPEFIASALETWAYEHKVELLFIQPGKPTQNAFIESFNSGVRDELLVANRFRTIFEARVAADAWRRAYNAGHPHSALNGMTPEEFLSRYETNSTATEITGRMTGPIPLRHGIVHVAFICVGRRPLLGIGIVRSHALDR